MSEREVEARLPRGQVVSAGVVRVHFDGACQPPQGGIATYGFTIEGEGLDAEECGLAVPPGSARATNNVAEYVAATRALEHLFAKKYHGSVVALGDSQLVIRQMNGEYEVRAPNLLPYHQRLRQLAGAFELVQFLWIRREDNARADELSKRALYAAQRERGPGDGHSGL